MVSTRTTFTPAGSGRVTLAATRVTWAPRAAAARVETAIRAEWGQMLITGWNRAGWMDLPARLGDRIGRLIGAAPGTVVLGDTLSIKVYQALASAIELNPGRKVILWNESPHIQ